MKTIYHIEKKEFAHLLCDKEEKVQVLWQSGEVETLDKSQFEDNGKVRG